MLTTLTKDAFHTNNSIQVIQNGFFHITRQALQNMQALPPRWNPPWRGEGAYLTKRLQPVYQQEQLFGAMLLRFSRTNKSY